MVAGSTCAGARLVSHLRFERVWSGRLADVSVELDTGVHVIIGAEAAGPAGSSSCASGCARHAAARSRSTASRTSRSPACRRTIAACYRTAGGGAGAASRAGSPRPRRAAGVCPQSPLERARLRRRARSRHCRAASAAGSRVTSPWRRRARGWSPCAEPLPAVAADDRPHVLARLAELGRERVVLVTTASHADAASRGTTFQPRPRPARARPGRRLAGAAAPVVTCSLRSKRTHRVRWFRRSTSARRCASSP